MPNNLLDDFDPYLVPIRKSYEPSDERTVPLEDRHAVDMLRRDLHIDDLVIYTQRTYEGRVMSFGTISKFLGKNAVEVRRVKIRDKGKEHCKERFPSKGSHLYKVLGEDINDLMLLLMQENKTLSEL